MTDIIRIPDINKYNITIENNELILTPIVKYRIVSEIDIENINLCSSTIMNCNIMNNEEIISNKTKYISILIDIFKSLPIQQIVQNTSINIILKDEKGNKGYKFYPELNISIQNKDANGTMKEIIKFVKLNNYKIEIYIKLNNLETIFFNF